MPQRKLSETEEERKTDHSLQKCPHKFVRKNWYEITHKYPYGH